MMYGSAHWLPTEYSTHERKYHDNTGYDTVQNQEAAKCLVVNLTDIQYYFPMKIYRHENLASN